MIKLIYEYGDLHVLKYSKPDIKENESFYVISILDINIKIPGADVEKMVRAIMNDITLSLMLEYGREQYPQHNKTDANFPLIRDKRLDEENGKAEE